MAPRKKSNINNRPRKRNNNVSVPAQQARSAADYIRDAVMVAEQLVASRNASLVPGLPRYCCKAVLVTVLTDLVKGSRLAHTLLHQNPVHLLRGLLVHIHPELLVHFQGYIQQLAFLDPSAPAKARSWSWWLGQEALQLGLMFPTATLSLAAKGVNVFSHFRHVPPIATKVMHDLMKLKLNAAQIRAVALNAQVLVHYAPDLLTSNAPTAGDGVDFVQSFLNILLSLTETQVQQVVAIVIIVIVRHQPAALSWFEGLDVFAVTRYLCAVGFEMEDGMCPRPVNLRRSI